MIGKTTDLAEIIIGMAVIGIELTFDLGVTLAKGEASRLPAPHKLQGNELFA